MERKKYNLKKNLTPEVRRNILMGKFPDKDWSKYEYAGEDYEGIVICSIHGEVSTPIYEKLVISTYGCPKCGSAKKTKVKSREKAIERISRVHPGMDFSNIDYQGSYKNIEFICPTHGKQIRTFQGAFGGKNACYECSLAGRVLSVSFTKDIFVKNAVALYGEVDDFTKTEYLNNHTLLTITCKTAGHGDYSITASNYLGHNRCRRCRPADGADSKPESELFRFLDKTGIDYIKNFTMPNKTELDAYFPELNFAIEFDGTYYHGEKFIRKMSLLEKTIYCKEKLGITLIHIFGDEWLFKRTIVENRLLSILGRSPRIHARKCIVREIPYTPAKNFIDLHHIQGNFKASLYFGLFEDNKIVAAMSFSNDRFGKRNQEHRYELVRYCSFGTVVGGFSKLLSAFIKLKNPKEIVSYSDKRWSIGNVYEVNGFTLENTSDPSYYWCIGNTRENRMNFMKHKLRNKFPDIYSKNKTEVQMCHEKGYWRIFDCGMDCWILKL